MDIDHERDRSPEGPPVVALVASAGGLEATMLVLADLPEDFGACVLVLIHQQPDRVNRLAELLRRRSVLPVRPAEDGLPLQAGQVLVAPPGHHLLITPELRTALIQSGAAPPSRPSADLLLTTLAVAAGPRATAAVLSGGGHDGATGATAIHAFGGTVLATDEASSALFSMPRATIERDNAVDHVVPLDELAGVLVELLAAPRA